LKLIEFKPIKLMI